MNIFELKQKPRLADYQCRHLRVAAAVPTPTCAGTAAIPKRKKTCTATAACSMLPKSATKSKRRPCEGKRLLIHTRNNGQANKNFILPQSGSRLQYLCDDGYNNLNTRKSGLSGRVQNYRRRYATGIICFGKY